MTFGKWIRTAEATQQLTRLLEENRRLDAALCGVQAEYPCLTAGCGERGLFMGMAPLSDRATYECRHGHISLVERLRRRA